MKTQDFVELSGDDFLTIKPYFKYSRTREVNKIDTVVLHWTGGSNVSGAVNTLQNLGYGYHFLIDKSGKVYQGSPLNKVVSHGGNSYGPNGRYVNSHSIGISFTILNGEDPFNDDMLIACKNLILNIKRSVPTIKYITGHHWVSPGRKVDPYTFDFDKLIRGLGGDFELWKTGYGPFPSGLNDCKCIKVDSNGNCIKSVGGCFGPGGYGYSERNLSTKVSDLSFHSDQDTV